MRILSDQNHYPSLPSGEIIAYGTVTRNLSEARLAEPGLSSLLASIVETSDDAIVSKNLDGVITSWNRGAERVFGYSAGEVVGQPITIVIPEDRQSEECEILTRVRRGGRIDHFETVRQRKDGSLIVVSLTVSPVKNAEGKIVGASKIARDITEQKRSQEQIATLAREATVGHLSASIAHEIRQPLASILANAEGALRWLEKAKIEEVRESLRDIVSEAFRASDIITNLRAMFKHDVQEKTLVDINKLVLVGSGARGDRSAKARDRSSDAARRSNSRGARQFSSVAAGDFELGHECHRDDEFNGNSRTAHKNRTEPIQYGACVDRRHRDRH